MLVSGDTCCQECYLSAVRPRLCRYASDTSAISGALSREGSQLIRK
jgi:hypothetical protein